MFSSVVKFSGFGVSSILSIFGNDNGSNFTVIISKFLLCCSSF
jgi:hypothetical protein